MSAAQHQERPAESFKVRRALESSSVGHQGVPLARAQGRLSENPRPRQGRTAARSPAASLVPADEPSGRGRTCPTEEIPRQPKECGRAQDPTCQSRASNRVRWRSRTGTSGHHHTAPDQAFRTTQVTDSRSSKLTVRVRFPSSAPRFCWSDTC
jgi:hypothetical protein